MCLPCRARGDPDTLDVRLRPGLCASLTQREHQVADAVAAGLTNSAVATALSIAVKTVECHLGHIYAKLGVSSGAELAATITVNALPTRAGASWRSLTAREQQVAMAVGTGLSTRQAARRLYLSPKTVEFHLGRVYRKLRIVSRRQLPAIVGFHMVSGLAAWCDPTDSERCPYHVAESEDFSPTALVRFDRPLSCYLGCAPSGIRTQNLRIRSP
jgi:DNA-binding CsgD family transcriptional regulator